MRKLNLFENFEINGNLFSEKTLSATILSDADSQSFRDDGTEHIFEDPCYKDSIVVYIKNNGNILIDRYIPRKK